MNENAAGMQARNPMAGREKTWDESTEAEKIEKLRRVLRMMMFRQDDLGALTAGLMQHQHTANGELVTPFREGQGYIGRPPGYRNDPLE